MGTPPPPASASGLPPLSPLLCPKIDFSPRSPPPWCGRESSSLCCWWLPVGGAAWSACFMRSCTSPSHRMASTSHPSHPILKPCQPSWPATAQGGGQAWPSLGLLDWPPPQSLHIHFWYWLYTEDIPSVYRDLSSLLCLGSWGRCEQSWWGHLQEPLCGVYLHPTPAPWSITVFLASSGNTITWLRLAHPSFPGLAADVVFSLLYIILRLVLPPHCLHCPGMVEDVLHFFTACLILLLPGPASPSKLSHSWAAWF